MKIAIRKEPSGLFYIDKEICSRFIEVEINGEKIRLREISDELLIRPPYNYFIIEVDDKYSDCEPSDFDDDLSFNINKYNTRKLTDENIKKLPKLIKELEELTKDIAQVQAGLIIPNIEEKKEEFRKILNEVRILQGKEPRKILEE